MASSLGSAAFTASASASSASSNGSPASAGSMTSVDSVAGGLSGSDSRSAGRSSPAAAGRRRPLLRGAVLGRGTLVGSVVAASAGTGFAATSASRGGSGEVVPSRSDGDAGDDSGGGRSTTVCSAGGSEATAGWSSHFKYAPQAPQKSSSGALSLPHAVQTIMSARPGRSGGAHVDANPLVPATRIVTAHADVAITWRRSPAWQPDRRHCRQPRPLNDLKVIGHGEPRRLLHVATFDAAGPDVRADRSTAEAKTSTRTTAASTAYHGSPRTVVLYARWRYRIETPRDEPTPRTHRSTVR